MLNSEQKRTIYIPKITIEGVNKFYWKITVVFHLCQIFERINWTEDFEKLLYLKNNYMKEEIKNFWIENFPVHWSSSKQF